MKISPRFYSKNHVVGSAIEGIIWLVVGVGALGVVGLQVLEAKKNAPPKPVEIMKVAQSPSELIPLIKDFLKTEVKGAQVLEIGEFGTIREDRYVGAKIKLAGSGETEDWVFSGPDDTITFGESATMVLRRLQQDAERSKNFSRLRTELAQLQKMTKK